MYKYYHHHHHCHHFNRCFCGYCYDCGQYVVRVSPYPYQPYVPWMQPGPMWSSGGHQNTVNTGQVVKHGDITGDSCNHQHSH